MAKSALGRLLAVFEKSQGVLSIQVLARELDVTPERVENLMDYWIQRGKIRSSDSIEEWSRCSVEGDCPFILEIPRTYEMVREGESLILEKPACK